MMYHYHYYLQTKLRPVCYCSQLITSFSRHLLTGHYAPVFLMIDLQFQPCKYRMASFLTSGVGLMKRFLTQAMHNIRMELQGLRLWASKMFNK